MLWQFLVSRLSIPGREKHDAFRKSVQNRKRTFVSHAFSSYSAYNVHFESAEAIPTNHVHICTQGEVCCIISEALNPIKGSDATDITHPNHKHLHRVCGCVHCTTSDSHSRKFPGWAHTNTNTHTHNNIQAHKLVQQHVTLHCTVSSVQRKTLYGPHWYLLFCHSLFTPTHQLWTLDSLWLSGGTSSSSGTEFTANQHTSLDSTSDKSWCEKEGDEKRKQSCTCHYII